MPELHDLARLVSSAAAARPDGTAVVAGTTRLTWSALDDEVSRLATGLGRAGVVAGQRVMLVLGNRLELVTTYLAVLRAQAVAVPVNPASTPGELARMLADSGSRLVLGDAATLAGVREAVAEVARARAGEQTDLAEDLVARSVAARVVTVGEPPREGELSHDDLRAAEAQPVPALPDPDRLAALLYTSGTSGRPRAAMLSHRALSSNLEQVAAVEPPMMRGDDVVLGVLPLFHVYGLNAVLGGVLRHGCTLVLAERFDPQGTLDLVEAERCTVLPLAPAVFPHWRDVEGLRERLASVRLVLSGSAPLAPEVVADFTGRTGIPLHQGYGLTEASPVVTSTLCSEQLKPGSVGAALPGVELRLVDSHGAAPEGEDPGEIEVRGAHLFSGYWPDGSGGPDADGWWPTGDVGFLDEAGRPVPRRPGQGAGRRLRLQRLPGRGRGGRGGGRRRRRRRGHRRPRRAHRRGGRRLRPRPRRRPRRGRGGRTGAVRGAAGPVQAAEPGRGGRRAAAHRHRQGAEGQAARAGAAPDHGAARVTARVTLYARQGCHLCDAARETVARVCAELGESFEEVDVDRDPELRERFTEEVPVTFVDGRQHDFWRVDEQRLRTALTR